ncbi:MAG: hsdM 1 [Candidatus Brocadiaceae bacterium]|nr:hsdM 1 [Candidatus Brocadiaceae bacterium]
MFEQTFKNIDDILHKDAGYSSELDYVEQTSWMLFLKYPDDFEKDNKTPAELAGQTYTPIISKEYRWNVWAAPKKGGKLDHHSARTGDDLKDFVDHKLFPYLKKFKTEAESPDTIEYKVGKIFYELKNKLQSGYNLREVLSMINELRFQSRAEKHETSHLYEGKIQILKAGGRAGVVIKNTFLSNTDNASVSLRKLLLESCNLRTMLDLPGGIFSGACVKTVVLFFEKGAPTQKVWFYQLNLDRNLGKTNPLNEDDLADFVALQSTKADSENSWSVNVADVDKTTFDLSVKNPRKKDEMALREPGKILDEMKALDEEAAGIVKKIKGIL